jgi:hypothetical protein
MTDFEPNCPATVTGCIFVRRRQKACTQPHPPKIPVDRNGIDACKRVARRKTQQHVAGERSSIFRHDEGRVRRNKKVAQTSPRQRLGFEGLPLQSEQRIDIAHAAAPEFHLE